MTLLIMMTNTIEYNEYKFGERKEAVIFSLRPLTTKLASALQQGVLYIFLIIASLSTFITKISDLHNQLTLGNMTDSQVGAAADIVVSTCEPWQVLVFKLGVAILPMVLFVVSYFLLKKYYFIDEKKYTEILEEIKTRKENNL